MRKTSRKAKRMMATESPIRSLWLSAGRSETRRKQIIPAPFW
jgi:hypothetical protein